MLYNKGVRNKGTKSSNKLSDIEIRGIHYVSFKEFS